MFVKWYPQKHTNYFNVLNIAMYLERLNNMEMDKY